MKNFNRRFESAYIQQKKLYKSDYGGKVLKMDKIRENEKNQVSFAVAGIMQNLKDEIFQPVFFPYLLSQRKISLKTISQSIFRFYTLSQGQTFILRNDYTSQSSNSILHHILREFVMKSWSIEIWKPFSESIRIEEESLTPEMLRCALFCPKRG